MSTINVQFSDSAQTEIVSYFGGPQNPSEHPNSGTVTTSDERWVAFYVAVEGSSYGLPPPTQSEL